MTVKLKSNLYVELVNFFLTFWHVNIFPNFWHCYQLYISAMGNVTQKTLLGLLSWCPIFNLTHWGRAKMVAIFADDIFKCIFFNENACVSIKISLKFVPKGSISNIPALVWIMAWRRPGNKPLSEPMMVRLPTHICVTQPQWVESSQSNSF